MGCAYPHPGSRVLPTRREDGVRERSGEHSWGARAGLGKEDGSGVCAWGGTRQMGDGRAHAIAIWRNGKHGRAAAACVRHLDVRALVSPLE
jgi:hypothetical protein